MVVFKKMINLIIGAAVIVAVIFVGVLLRRRNDS
jgi:hypothetical protein